MVLKMPKQEVMSRSDNILIIYIALDIETPEGEKQLDELVPHVDAVSLISTFRSLQFLLNR